MQPDFETEVKIALEDDSSQIQADLRRLGFTLVEERHFEDNYLLDLPGNFLQKKKCSLRVRMIPEGGELTFKGPPEGDRYFKVREEMNTRVTDPQKLLEILKRLGFQIFFRYQKYRTIFKRGKLLAMVDKLPIGAYFELEGEKEEIQKAAESLGFSPQSFIVASYMQLHKNICMGKGIPQGDMIFSQPEGGESISE